MPTFGSSNIITGYCIDMDSPFPECTSIPWPSPHTHSHVYVTSSVHRVILDFETAAGGLLDLRPLIGFRGATTADQRLIGRHSSAECRGSFRHRRSTPRPGRHRPPRNPLRPSRRLLRRATRRSPLLGQGGGEPRPGISARPAPHSTRKATICLLYTSPSP